MSSESGIYRQLLTQLAEGSDINAVLQALESLEKASGPDQLPNRDKYELVSRAFQALRQLTADAPNAAEPLILERLLPYCVTDCPSARVPLAMLQQCLADWCSQYTEAVNRDLRQKALGKLHPFLETGDPRAACWTASYIGYREDGLVDALWAIVRNNDSAAGDTALSTLVALGVPDKGRNSILTELHKRATMRSPSLSLISALSRIADPTSVQVVYENWLDASRQNLQASDLSSAQPIRGSFVLGIFRSVLDSKSDAAALQDQIWQMLVSLADEQPQEYANDFYLGQTAPMCNSVLVASQMLKWLAQQTDQQKNPEWARYLIGLRLEECVRPRQLEGWADISGEKALELLHHDACQDTGHDVVLTTQQDMVKKKAWETLFRAGHKQALDWFCEAVEQETSGFIQQTIMEWFSVFRIEPLPEIVVQWIQEPYSIEPGKVDSRKLAPRMAAIRMARSAASREAFCALLGFGLTVDGQVLEQSVEALADVALHLIRQGDVSVTEELLGAIANGREHTRIAASYAFQQVAAFFPSLVLDHARKLVSAARDQSRKALERGTLVSTLGYARGWRIPSEFLKDLEVWAHEPERWVGGGSLEALARHGYLFGNQQLMQEILGLRHVEDGWDLADTGEYLEWRPYILGLLYYDHSQELAPAFARLLQTSDFLHVPQIYGWLIASHLGLSRPPLPRVIRDALIKRVYSGQSQTSSETGGFEVLARLAPRDLAQEEWEGVWSKWLADSRAALADALGEADLDTDSQSKAVSHLQLLAGDGQYAVRRAAYRALARQSMDALHKLCLSWSVAPSAELRQRAAEACGWLGLEQNKAERGRFEELYQELSVDREKSVREVAKRAWVERRKRHWAQQYLSIVMNVQGQTNGEMLDVWRYGDALTRVGDDSCIRALKEHRTGKVHPPNVRYWLERIIEGLQKNWRETTQKWPDPWFAWSGQIEKGRGKLLALDGQVLEIEYSIWLQPAREPSEHHDWGGAAWPIPILSELGASRIEFADGRQGQVMVSRISGGIAVFRGNGPYPS